jgi:hypothetical protein
MSKVRSKEKLSLLTPFVWTSKISLNASTSQTVTLKYNRVHGATLLKVYHGIYNATEATNTAYDHLILLQVFKQLIYIHLQLLEFMV